MSLDYKYQGVNAAGDVVTWQWATPDPSGSHAGQTVTDVVQTNHVVPDGSAPPWSGIGLTGSVQPTGLVLGAGLTGEDSSGVVTLRTTPTLRIVDDEGSTVLGQIAGFELVGLQAVDVGSGIVRLSAQAATLHQPVLGATSVDIFGYDAVGQTLPIPYANEYDGDRDLLEPAPSTWTAGIRILVHAQNTVGQNGVYVTQGNGLMLRSGEIWSGGDLVLVAGGRAWGGTLWVYRGSGIWAPPRGSPTHAAYDVYPVSTEPDGWLEIRRVLGPSGVDAGDYQLTVRVVGRCANTSGEQRYYDLSATYRGNPAGDLSPIGPALNFQPPAVTSRWPRLRAVVDGSALIFEGYHDDSTDPDYADADTWTYSLEITAEIRRVR